MLWQLIVCMIYRYLQCVNKSGLCYSALRCSQVNCLRFCVGDYCHIAVPLCHLSVNCSSFSSVCYVCTCVHVCICLFVCVRICVCLPVKLTVTLDSSSHASFNLVFKFIEQFLILCLPFAIKNLFLLAVGYQTFQTNYLTMNLRTSASGVKMDCCERSRELSNAASHAFVSYHILHIHSSPSNSKMESYYVNGTFSAVLHHLLSCCQLEIFSVSLKL